MKFGVIYVLFILLGIFLNGITCIGFSLVKEYFTPTVAGSSIGIANFFAFVGSAIF